MALIHREPVGGGLVRIVVDAAPTGGGGIAAPVGSTATGAGSWEKVGAADTDWRRTDGVLTVTTVDVATYNLLVSDDVLDVTRTATGACAIDLPTAQVIAGRVIEVKDGGFNAAAFNISITTEGAALIDGAASLVIAVSGASVTLVCNGVDWRIV